MSTLLAALAGVGIQFLKKRAANGSADCVANSTERVVLERCSSGVASLLPRRSGEACQAVKMYSATHSTRAPLLGVDN